MWAGGHQQPSANAQQWWPMSYNYQYQNQPADSSQDWAAKAALWAQQRMAQEQMAQYYQQQPQPQVDHSQLHQQPVYSGYQPDAQVNVGQQPPVSANSQQFHPEVDATPLPPEEEGEPPVPGWQGEERSHVADNIETVVMDDEAEETQTVEIEEDNGHSHVEQQDERERHGTITQDYNHQPPPTLPGMQTFDHNHGFNRPPPPQFSHVAPQPIDYGHGHQSLDYGHQGPLVPGAQVYDYQPQFEGHYYHQHPYEMDRHHHRFAHEHGKPKGHPHVDSLPDISGLSDVKKKALPMWIREGLEKLEKKKQKKLGQAEEEEPKKSNVNLSGSVSSIAGYDHSKVHSPVHTPKSNDSNEEGEEEKGSDESSEAESDQEGHGRSSSAKEHHSRKASPPPKKTQSSDEEEIEKTEEEKQRELMVNIRKLLTEVLLTVTSEEVTKIAQETYNEALKGPARQLQHSGGLDALRGKGGFLGLGGYGSDSESESEQESGEERPYANQEDRKHLSVDMEENQQTQRSHSHNYSGRGTRRHDVASESEEEEAHKRLKRHDSGERHIMKEKRHQSPSSSVSESSSSVSARHKSRRKKHHRRDRSDSSSPKHRRKHHRRYGKKSRSRSRSPKHSSSKKKRKSISESESETDIKISSRRRSSKHRREYSEKKQHRRKRRSSSSSSYNEREGKKDRKRKA